MQEIMTIEEVASYLKVSERTVYEWAQKGDLPGGKIGTTWRFKSSDIEKWINDRLDNHLIKNKDNESLNVLTTDRVLILNSDSKLIVFEKLINSFSNALEVKNLSALRKGILEREKLMSTGIGFGIGVPHVRCDAVNNIIMAVAICKNGIEDYDSLDGEPVKIVCMLVARADQHKEYLRMLSSISSRLKDKSVRKQLLDTNDSDSVISLLIR